MTTTDAGDGETDRATQTLSTGHRVELPLSTEATMTGVVLPASLDAVRELLPDELTAVRATPTRGAVALLCVDYHRIGRRNDIEPYEEFGVLVPAVHDATPVLSSVSILTRGLSGYVWYLPVTTEPAKALGVDVWGFPKEVTEIRHTDEGSARRTTVRVDGRRLVDLTVARPPTVRLTVSPVCYAKRDGRLLRVKTELDGDVGFWPFSRAFSYTLGDHPRAERLKSLGLGDRALLRFAADVRFVVHGGVPVEAR